MLPRRGSKKWLDPGTGLVDPGATTRLRLPPPAAREAICHGQPGRRWTPQSVAGVLGTVQLPNALSGALSERFGLNDPNGTPLLTDLRKEGDPRVSGPPHSLGGPSTGDSGDHAPRGRQEQRSAHPTLALLSPVRALGPQPKIVQVLQGATLGGTSFYHQDYGGFLFGTERRQRCVVTRPRGTQI